MGFFSEPILWKIEEIADCSIVLSHTETPKPKSRYTILPNPDYKFIEKYGRSDYPTFIERFSKESKDAVYTPEILVLYFEDKVPEWAEVGMEVIIN